MSKQSDLYWEGYKKCLDCKTSNPYDYGSKEHDEWLHGRWDAYDDITQGRIKNVPD